MALLGDADGPLIASAAMQTAPGGELRAALDRIAVHERGLKKTWLHAVLQLLGPTRWFAAVYRRLGPKLDPWLFRVTGGRIATRLYGFPSLLLITTGAKTGLQRTSPLLYVRDGDDFVVVGTNFGTEHHPAWTANLLKTPEAALVVGEDTLPVIAALCDRAAFERLWPRFTAVYGGYRAYLARLTGREPRMFLLRPTPRG
jgi:deazaflavin-dependent oxidoreductase (nitroreductase family)